MTPSGSEPPPGDEPPPGGEPEPGGEQDRRWRRVLWSLPSGLYVVGSRAGDRRNLMTANWVTQVATEPRQVAVAVERDSVTLGLMTEGGAFAVSLLSRDERALVRRFVRPVPAGDVAVDASGAGTMREVPVRAEVTGAPVLEVAVAWVDCRVGRAVELGSHTLVVGTVVGAGFGPGGEGAVVLTMADTRMNYGG